MLEPQDNMYCCGRKNKKGGCLSIVLLILTAALTFSIGLIVGASNSAAILAGIVAIIVLISVLALLVLINIILLLCNIRK